MAGDDDLSIIMDQDKAKNPSCSYSQTNSSSCRSTNGQSVCEVLTRITRMCPGQRPVDIYSNSITENTDASSSSTLFGKHHRASDNDFGRHQQDPFAIFDSLFRELNHGFGGSQSQTRYPQRPSPFGRAPDRPAFDQQFPRFDGDDNDNDDREGSGGDVLARGPNGHASGPIERI